MFVLMLNDMRSPKIDVSIAVVRAESTVLIERLLKSEKVEPYKDGAFNKHFKQGGPLEWFNPPTSSASIRCVGTMRDWTDKAAQQYQDEIMVIPTVDSFRQKLISQIFTFGAGQKYDGCYVELFGYTEEECREIMTQAFGKKWSMQYNSRESAGVLKNDLKEIQV